MVQVKFNTIKESNGEIFIVGTLEFFDCCETNETCPLCCNEEFSQIDCMNCNYYEHCKENWRD